MRLTGAMPSAAKIEARRRALEGRYERYRSYKESADYQRFCELQQLVEGGGLERAKEQAQLETFKGSREESVLLDLAELEKNPEVKAALKGKGDTNSPDYQRYKSLRQRADSEEFKKRVAFLKSKNRFASSDMGQAEKEYKSLSKSRELKWFQQQTKKGVFDELDRREELFFDDFNAGALDKSKWLTRFFWGEAMIQKPFSFIRDPHCYTDGSNISLENGCLVIETRPERASGMAWDSKMGFLPKDFDYTSGLVCTGHSFRLQNGRFEAKMRFHADPGVFHSFYLVGEKMLPQIDVFRTNPEDGRYIRGMYSHGSIAKDGHVNSQTVEESVGRLPFGNEFFILSVEWGSGKIVWSINGVPYMEQSGSLPKEPLYLVIASGIVPGALPSGTSRLEVDWVRCLSEKK